MKRTKRSLKMSLSFLLSICLLLAMAPMMAYATTPSVWIVDSADKAYDGSTLPANATTSISLYAAKGEYEAAQICVRNNDGSARTVDSITMGDLSRQGGGGTISAAQYITVRREYIHGNVTLMEGYDGDPADNETPAAGSTGYPDALVGTGDVLDWFNAASIAANKTGIYWYNVYVPAGQAAGIYTGTVIFNIGVDSLPVNVSITVYNVTIPETNQATFKMNNWVFANGWDPLYDILSNMYGYSIYSANWWTVLANWAADLKKHRNNVVLVDLLGLLMADSTIDDDSTADYCGTMHFNWQKFDQYVQTFIDAGAAQHIRAFAQMGKIPRGVLLRGLAKTNSVVTITNYNAGTVIGESFLDQLFPALKAHLEQKTQQDGWPAWSDFLYMSSLDEPANEDHCIAMDWFLGIYHQYFSSPSAIGKAMDTTGGYAEYLGSDAVGLCPMVQEYYPKSGFFQTQKNLGKELWIYVCCYPAGAYMNRFTSQQLDKSRMIFWYNWKEGATGYLHWAWNNWNGYTAQQVLDENYAGNPQDGDCWIVMPDTGRMSVYDSIRYEAQLDGIEDYELLNILSQTKPAEADRIVNNLIKSPKEYTRSGADVTAAHKALLDAIVSSGPDTVPYSAFMNTEYNQADTGTQHSYILGNCAVGSDFTVNMDIKINAVGAEGNADWAGCVIRGLDKTFTTGYLVAFRNSGSLLLFKDTGLVMSEASIPGYTAGQYTNVKIVVSGNNIKVYAGNGTTASTAPLLDYTDTSTEYTAGNVQLYTFNTNSSFKNIVISQGTNSAQNATVTASSSHEGNGWSTTKATDGQRSSIGASSMGWSSSNSLGANHSEWVKVDLGQSRNISRVDLYPRNDSSNVGYGFPLNFSIQLSNDNANWNTVVSKTGYALPGNEVQSFAFPVNTARYVRILGTSLRQNPNDYNYYRMQFAEIEAYDEIICQNLWGGLTGSYWGNGTPYELGTRFMPSVSGKITKIRVYSVSGESGNHTARIWNDSTGSVVGGPYTITFGGSNGWYEYTLATPVYLDAGTEYTVSVSTGTDANKYMAVTTDNGNSPGSNGGCLSYPAYCGVATTTMGSRPTTSGGCNYLRDVVFVPSENILGSMGANYYTTGTPGTPYELGTKFMSSVNGKITKIRVYSVSQESGSHTARIWNDSTGSVVGGPYTITFGGSDGWIEYTLATPVSVSAGTEYTISVSTGTDAGKYFAFWTLTGAFSGGNGNHLTYPANYGVATTSMGTRPTTSGGCVYLRDVVFVPD